LDEQIANKDALLKENERKMSMTDLAKGELVREIDRQKALKTLTKF